MQEENSRIQIKQPIELVHPARWWWLFPLTWPQVPT